MNFNRISPTRKVFGISLISALLILCGGCSKTTEDKDTQLINAIQKLEIQQHFAWEAMDDCYLLEIPVSGPVNPINKERSNGYRATGNKFFVTQYNDAKSDYLVSKNAALASFKKFYLEKKKSEKMAGQDAQWSEDQFVQNYVNIRNSAIDDLISDLFGLPKGTKDTHELLINGKIQTPLSDVERIAKCDAMAQRIINGEFDIQNVSDPDLKEVLSRAAS